jgi:hypothetical protein
MNFSNYQNYIKTHDVYNDPNYFDNMICAVDVPQKINDLNDLKYVKCKDFLQNNPNYQFTFARPILTPSSTPQDIISVMPKSYKFPGFSSSSDVPKYFISMIPKDERKIIDDLDRKGQHIAKDNWIKICNNYCQYQDQDQDKCLKNCIGPYSTLEKAYL